MVAGCLIVDISSLGQCDRSEAKGHRQKWALWTTTANVGEVYSQKKKNEIEEFGIWTSNPLIPRFLRPESEPQYVVSIEHSNSIEHYKSGFQL